MLNNQTTGYSLSDVAAVTNANEGWGGGASWWIIILFLFCFMGGGGNGLWGNNAWGKQPATTDDVQNQFNFASLERQNNEIVQAVNDAAYNVTGAVKDGNAFTQSMMKDIAYDINGELKDNATLITSNVRDVKDVVQANNYEIGRGFSAVNANIDSIRYDNAMNTKELLASNCAQTQKILDVLAGNRMADMQNQINALQLQAATCGVVRYPMATTYTMGYPPFYGPGTPGPGPFGNGPAPGPF